MQKDGKIMYSQDGSERKSNTRPVAIFSSYMLLCLSLTLLILRSLYLHSRSASAAQSAKHDSTRTRQVLLFSLLAIISLGTTWYYMFCFFSHSYREWAWSQSLSLSETMHLADLELGAWLRDTKLFKEAWGTALETPGRFWWTQQIFFFASILSLFLGHQGYDRQIPHLWAYMLLGQVVAISFATNLFFLAASLRPVPPESSKLPPPDTKRWWTPPLSILLIPFLATFICTGMIPSSVSKPYFMSILLLPHIALFIPPMLYSITPESLGTLQTSSRALKGFYEHIYAFLMAVSFIFVSWATKTAWGSILAARYEHPAVSSVGWDVILCWISWGVWILVQTSMRVVSLKNTGEEKTILS